jgi:hypothetical protein
MTALGSSKLALNQLSVQSTTPPIIHSVFEGLKVAEHARGLVGYNIELSQFLLEDWFCFFLDELAGR